MGTKARPRSTVLGEILSLNRIVVEHGNENTVLFVSDGNVIEYAEDAKYASWRGRLVTEFALWCRVRQGEKVVIHTSRNLIRGVR